MWIFTPIVVAVAWAGRMSLLSTRRLCNTLTCVVVSTATSIFVVLYFVYLLLANALANIFLSRILLTALSLPTLVERVGWRRRILIFVGFGGLL